MKEGYKQTEIGVIPEDWEVKPLNEIAPLQRGFDLPYSQMEEGKYPVVFSNGVGAFHNAYMAKGPGVITGRSGTIGKVHYISTNYWPHNTTLWVTDFHGNDEKYVYYLFQTVPWELFNSGSSVPTLNRNDVHDTLHAIPPRPEQRRIAEALSDMDELIASLEKLIAKKKAIKQGAMQELLTGKRRLPGFTGEWREVPIGEWGYLTKECVNPQLYPAEFFWEYSMPAYDKDAKPVKQVGKNMHSNRTRIKGTVLLFNKLNVRQKRIWHVDNCGSNAVCSSEFLAYCSEKIDLRLVKYILGTDTATSDFVGMSTGTSNSQKRITPDCFLEYKISIPVEIKEQNAIADILENIDKECRVLEDKLEKARQIKHGMMQQLLTGKIRLLRSTIGGK